MRFEVIRHLWQRLLASAGDRNVLDTDSITESERQWGLMVAPAIEDHERERQRLGDLADVVRALDTVLRLLPIPALVLEDQGDILCANDAARALVNGRYMPASLLRDALHAINVQREIETMIETDDPSVPGGRMRIVPAEIAGGPPKSPRGPHVVFLVSNAGHPLVKRDELIGHFGLTSRQADVVVRIAAGMTAAEAARALSIDSETVKKHLAAAYEKMGVNNRASLVAAAYGARFGQAPPAGLPH